MLDAINKTTPISEAYVGILQAVTTRMDDVRRKFQELNPELFDTSDSLAGLASEAIAASVDFGKGFAKITTNITELQRELTSFEKGADAAKFTDILEQFDKLKDLKPAALATLAKQLGISSTNALDLAIAVAEMQAKIKEASDTWSEYEANAKRVDSLNEDLTQRISLLGQEFENLKKGTAGGKEFSAVEKEVQKFRDRLSDAGGMTATMETRLIELSAALQLVHEQKIRNKTADEARASALRDANKAEREALSLATRQAELRRKSGNEFDLIRKRINALKGGSQALEEFEKITTPLERFRSEMEKLKIPEEERMARAERFKQLLIEQKHAQDNFNNSSQLAARATVGAFERIITGAKSVNDALRELGQEILNIIIRATILKPIENALVGSFGGLFSGGGGGVSLAGINAGQGDFGPSSARGSRFTIGGSGGIDSKLLRIPVSPGEDVQIRRRQDSGGGGGANIQTINHNDFTGRGAVDRAAIKSQLDDRDEVLTANLADLIRRKRLS